MTDFFLRLCTKKGEAPDSPSGHARIGRRAGFVGILLNLLLFGAKLTMGLLTHSLAITADGINNLTDAAASVITFLGFYLARRPADREHPFGHARYEYLSGLAVSVVILLAGIELLKSSVEKILRPGTVEMDLLALLLLLLCAGVKLFMAFFYGTLGKAIRSETLQAAAKDSRNDVFATLAVLLGGGVSLLFGLNIDGWLGLGVALFILWSGISSIGDTASVLLGQPADGRLERRLIRLISSREKVLGCHDFLYHDYGHGRSYASIHVEFSASESPMDCHEIIDELEREAFALYHVQLLIHYDPVLTDSPELQELRRWVQQEVAALDEHISIHDLRIITQEGCKKLIFDMALPYSLYGHREDYTLRLQKRLQEEQKDYELLIDYDAY